jgi:hypothetical protein
MDLQEQELLHCYSMIYGNGSETGTTIGTWSVRISLMSTLSKVSKY